MKELILAERSLLRQMEYLFLKTEKRISIVKRLNLFILADWMHMLRE